MLRTQVYLDENEYEQAKIIAQKLGVSVSKLVREGIRNVLQKYKAENNDPLRDLSGKYIAGDPDLATNLDNSLYTNFD